MTAQKFSKIIWFTGLSGAGKTTLSKQLNNQLKKKFKVFSVDGDTFREKNKNKNLTSKILF